MPIARNTFLAATALLALALPVEAGALKRVKGEVNFKTYPGFFQLLLDSLENKVVLDVTLPVDNDESEGHLSTFVLDGQFEIAHHAGPDGSNIYADVGFDLVDDKYYTLQGTYVVQPAGMHDGRPWLQLEASEDANEGFVDVKVDELKGAN